MVLTNFSFIALMKKYQKAGIALAAVVLGLIVSPAVSLNEAGGVKKAVQFIDMTSSSVKDVKIVGLEEVSFAPNTLNIKEGDIVIFTNVDGSKGGTAHYIISVKTGTFEPDGIFSSGIIKVGEKFQVTFQHSGIYDYVDIIEPTIPGRIVVS